MLESISKNIPISITTQALLLGVTVGVITYYTLFKKKYKLPPGPPALPLIGNLIALIRGNSLYKQLMRWRKTYGPIMTIYFGPLRCITLNDANAANEALVKKAADYAGRYQTYSLAMFSSGFKNIVFANITPAWKLQRKLVHQALRQYLSGSKLEEKVYESTVKVMKEIENKKEKPFNLLRYISLLVYNLLNGVCFNKRFDIDDKKFLETLSLIDQIDNSFGFGFWEDVFPPLRAYPTAKFRKTESLAQRFIAFLNEEYAEHLKKTREGKPEDITDYLMNARKEAIAEDPEIENIMTEEHVRRSVSDVFFAGTDTTRQTLHWTILYLSRHPEIQKKVHAEVDEVFDIGQCPTLNDRNKLSYTEAVLHESMRIRPVTPVGLPHRTLSDCTIGEYDVPKGTMVLINQYALHHDPDWWKDPEEFRPERFLDEDGKLAPKTLSWLPFSAGRRNCLGESIARPEMHLILAILLRNFTFRFPDTEKVDLEAYGHFSLMSPTVDLIASPRQ